MMRILKVIHGYPDRYSAGSEVYSRNLCHELVEQGHEVVVFTRQEDAYKREYSIEWEEDLLNPKVKLCIINMTHSRDGYSHSAVDEAFDKLLVDFVPDVVHIGHLNHLSTSLLGRAHSKRIPILFTLHDFWLMCPRGQFLQCINSLGDDLYPVCHSQENEKCAKHCYRRYFSSQEDGDDLQFWTRWVEKRMNHIRDEVVGKTDLFVAPSIYLQDRFINDFDIDPSKMVYIDYGFHLDRLQNRKRKQEELLTFGYIGTHKQAKGIFHLLQAFEKAHEGAQLKIWGPSMGTFTESLKSYVSNFDPKVRDKIKWMGGYSNKEIVDEVFNHVDAIVVPSIWGENSPLVIHEAIEAKLPVITADFGGMKEYIHHNVNGLLFRHRDPKDLCLQMQRLINEPKLSVKLSRGGYLQSSSGHIPGIKEHVNQIISYYNSLILAKEPKR
jgi:glycosyltransferase involved in cell wall biosynthesis